MIGVQRTWKTDLVEIRAAEKKAIFQHMETGEQTVMDYSMLHVSPPMSAPDFIKNSPSPLIQAG